MFIDFFFDVNVGFFVGIWKIGRKKVIIILLIRKKLRIFW